MILESRQSQEERLSCWSRSGLFLSTLEYVKIRVKIQHRDPLGLRCSFALWHSLPEAGAGSAKNLWRSSPPGALAAFLWARDRAVVRKPGHQTAIWIRGSARLWQINHVSGHCI